MSTPLRTPVATATYRVKFRKESPRDQTGPSDSPAGAIPRVARLLALAHKIDGMIRSGELKNWAEAARLIGITRARMTQIANLLLLASQIQASILGLTSVVSQGPIFEHHLRSITAAAHWIDQQRILCVLHIRLPEDSPETLTAAPIKLSSPAWPFTRSGFRLV